MIEVTVEGDSPHLTSIGAAIHRLLESNGVKATLTVEEMLQSVETPARLQDLDISTVEVKVFNPEKEL